MEPSRQRSTSLPALNLFPWLSATSTGDGVADLVVANARQVVFPFNPGGVSVLLGNDDGTFQAIQDFAAGNWQTIASSPTAEYINRTPSEETLHMGFRLGVLSESSDSSIASGTLTRLRRTG